MEKDRLRFCLHFFLSLEVFPARPVPSVYSDLNLVWLLSGLLTGYTFMLILYFSIFKNFLVNYVKYLYSSKFNLQN